jgi:hypothetical protein
MAKLPKKKRDHLTKKDLGKKAPKKKKSVDINEGKLKVGEQDIDVFDPEIKDGDMLNDLRASVNQAKAKQTGKFATVGLSMGVTLNVGDYQSARVDLYISRNVPDNDKSIDKAIGEISTKILEEIERQSGLLTGDE